MTPNPQPAPEHPRGKYGNCRVCDRPLRSNGECLLAAHSQEAEVEPINNKPQVEDEIQGGDVEETTGVTFTHEDKEAFEEWGRTLKSQADAETGEIPGQLLLGINVPTVEVQRRGHKLMTPYEFNRATWNLEEGDRMTAVRKGDYVVVKVVKAWEVSNA